MSDNVNRLARLKNWAQRLKRNVVTVYFAARDPETPLGVRVLAGLVAAYALSPIDLIPDFIPVLGYLDDLIIVPIGLLLVLRMIPEEVLARSRVQADTLLTKPHSLTAALCIVAVWTGLAATALLKAL